MSSPVPSHSRGTRGLPLVERRRHVRAADVPAGSYHSNEYSRDISIEVEGMYSLPSTRPPGMGGQGFQDDPSEAGRQPNGGSWARSQQRNTGNDSHPVLSASQSQYRPPRSGVESASRSFAAAPSFEGSAPGQRSQLGGSAHRDPAQSLDSRRSSGTTSASGIMRVQVSSAVKPPSRPNGSDLDLPQRTLFHDDHRREKTTDPYSSNSKGDRVSLRPFTPQRTEEAHGLASSGRRSRRASTPSLLDAVLSATKSSPTRARLSRAREAAISPTHSERSLRVVSPPHAEPAPVRRGDGRASPPTRRAQRQSAPREEVYFRSTFDDEEDDQSTITTALDEDQESYLYGGSDGDARSPSGGAAARRRPRDRKPTAAGHRRDHHPPRAVQRPSSRQRSRRGARTPDRSNQDAAADLERSGVVAVTERLLAEVDRVRTAKEDEHSLAVAQLRQVYAEDLAAHERRRDGDLADLKGEMAQLKQLLKGQDHPTHPDTMVLVKENSELRKLLIDVLQQKQHQQSSAPSTPAPASAEPAPQPPSRPQYQSPDRDSSRRAINRRQPASYQSSDESRPKTNGGGVGRHRDGDDDMQIVSSGWKARAEAAEAAVRELQNQLRDVRNGRSQDAATGAAEREAAVVDATASLRRSLQSLSHDSAETIRELRDQISSLQQQLSEARQEAARWRAEAAAAQDDATQEQADRLAALERELRREQDEARKAENDAQSNADLVGVLERRIDHLKQNLQQAVADTELAQAAEQDAKANLKAAERDAQALRSSNDDAERRIQRLESALTMHQNEVEALEDRLAAAAEQSDNLHRQLREAEEKLSRQEIRLRAELSQAHAATEQRMHDAEQALARLRLELEKKVGSHEAAQGLWRREREQLKDAQQDALDERDDAIRALDAERLSKTKLVSEMHAAEAKNIQLNGQLRTSQRQVETLQDELAALEEALANKAKATEVEGESLAALQEQLRAAKRRADDFERQVQETAAAASSLEGRLRRQFEAAKDRLREELDLQRERAVTAARTEERSIARDEAQQAREELQEEYDAAMDRLKQQYDDQLRARVDLSQNASAQARQEMLDAQATQLRKEYENRMRQLQAEAEVTLADRTRELTKSLNAEHQRAVDQLERRLREEHKAEMRDLEARLGEDHDMEVARLRSSLKRESDEAEMSQLQQEAARHKAAMTEAREAWHAEKQQLIREWREECESRVANAERRAERQWQDEKRSLLQQHELDEEERQEEVLASARREWDQEKQREMKALMREQESEWETKLQMEQRKWDAEWEQRLLEAKRDWEREARDELNASRQKADGKLREKLQSEQQRWEAEIESRLADARREWQLEKSREMSKLVEESDEKIQSKLTAAEQQRQREVADAVASARRDWEEHKQDAVEEAVATAREQWQRELVELREKWESRVHTVSTELRETYEYKQQELSQSKSDAVAAAVAEANKVARREMEALKNAWEKSQFEAVAETEAAATRQLEDERAEHEEELKALQAQHAQELKQRLAKIRKEWEEDVEQVRESLLATAKRELSEERVTHNKRIQAMEREMAEALSSARKNWEAQRDKLEAELSDCLDKSIAMEQEHEAAVSEVLAGSQKQMESEVQRRVSELVDEWERKLARAEEERQNAMRFAKREFDATQGRAGDLEEQLQRVTMERDKYYEAWKRESKRRRDAYNKVMDLQGNIRVHVRVRPEDTELGLEVPASLRMWAEKPVERRRRLQLMQDGEMELLIPDRDMACHYDFDEVHPPTARQEDIFGAVRPLVESALDGYNICTFAYGQTGSGKTYTMEGTTREPGVIVRTLHSLFALAGERGFNTHYTFQLSMMEVYNEQIRDLLNDENFPSTEAILRPQRPRAKDKSRQSEAAAAAALARSQDVGQTHKPVNLQVRENEDGTAVVVNLTRVPVSSPQDALEVIGLGSKRRAIGAHNLNEHSSRSHMVVRLWVDGIVYAASAASSNEPALSGSTLARNQIASPRAFSTRSRAELDEMDQAAAATAVGSPTTSPSRISFTSHPGSESAASRASGGTPDRMSLANQAARGLVTQEHAKFAGLKAVRFIQSELNLVDLAGSERIDRTASRGDRLEEAKRINSSLTALGKVISAHKRGDSHVPYRDSRLTFLLKNSLSGQSKVLMFANVSQDAYNIEETMYSLSFAARCRSVALGRPVKHGRDARSVAGGADHAPSSPSFAYASSPSTPGQSRTTPGDGRGRSRDSARRTTPGSSRKTRPGSRSRSPATSKEGTIERDLLHHFSPQPASHERASAMASPATAAQPAAKRYVKRKTVRIEESENTFREYEVDDLQSDDAGSSSGGWPHYEGDDDDDPDPRAGAGAGGGDLYV